MERLHTPVEQTPEEGAPRFTVSLRLRHPHISADAISKAFEIQPDRAWTVGEERTTPTGGSLGGIRDDTYWCHRISIASPDYPSSKINASLHLLEKARAFLKDFVESGGTAEYFVGWFSGPMSGDSLEAELLRRMGDLGVGIALDVYCDHNP